jgi:hypothetical protein
MVIGVVTVSGTNILHKVERRTPVEENSAHGNVTTQVQCVHVGLA